MEFLTEEQRELMSSVCMPRINHRDKQPHHRSSSGKLRKAGSGGKSWSRFDDMLDLDIHHGDDSSYDTDEDHPYWLVEAPVADSVKEFKARVSLIINEYFSSSNISEAGEELRDLGCPDFHHYFVKKLISKSLDQHDRDKEKAALLLSALHADVIAPQQLTKGFIKLLQSMDDLILDAPNAVDPCSVFLSRAIFDGILPPRFLPDCKKLLPEDSRGAAAVDRAVSRYSGPSRRSEVEDMWGGSSGATVEALTNQIDKMLQKYLGDGDEAAACEFIRRLNVPFFHHEVVKRTAEMSRSGGRDIPALLRRFSGEGLISSSQMIKGFNRLADSNPELKEELLGLGLTAGYLPSPMKTDVNSAFKNKATAIIHEYFSSDDPNEVVSSMHDVEVAEKQALFIKRLVLVAMDRKSREKEMASALIASLQHDFEAEQIVKGFSMLLRSAEDTALDIPDAGTQLSFFLARAVYDNALLPFNMEEIRGEMAENSLGREIVGNAKSILSARHAGERILRCWGGGTGWAIEDAKEKVFKIVEEFEAGGDLSEACRCIREMDLPFFHHEVVKQVLDMAMEKQNDKVVELLRQCAGEGLISGCQMYTGFKRVFDLLEELALDVPNAEGKFWSYVRLGIEEKWLTSDFLEYQ